MVCIPGTPPTRKGCFNCLARTGLQRISTADPREAELGEPPATCGFAAFPRICVLPGGAVFDAAHSEHAGRNRRGAGWGIAGAADTAEIEALRLAIDSQVPMERCSYMEVGNTVEIIQGPLSGLRGLLVNVRKSHRLVLSVRLLCRSVLIEIDPQWVAAHEESLILSDHTSPEFGMSC